MNLLIKKHLVLGLVSFGALTGMVSAEDPIEFEAASDGVIQVKLTPDQKADLEKYEKQKERFAKMSDEEKAALILKNRMELLAEARKRNYELSIGATLVPDKNLETGMRVTEVYPNGPADVAGIKEGDVMGEFLGEAIRVKSDYEWITGSVGIGEKFQVKMLVNGQLEPKVLVADGRVKGAKFTAAQHDKMRRVIDRMLRDIQEGRVTEKQIEDGVRTYAMMGLFVEDESGARYRLKVGIKGQELDVWDKDRKLLFSGPFETKADRDAVPADLMEKAVRLGMAE